MKKWEYAVWITERPGVPGSTKESIRLDYYGLNGWELVSSVGLLSGDTKHVFKRELVSEEMTYP